MSVALVNLAYKIKSLTSSEKSVLVRLSWHADANAECYPSIKSIAEDTSLDRKTVQKILLDLINKLLIIDTGKRQGRTKSVPVYKLTLSDPKIGPALNISDPNFSRSDPKNGITKRSQNWDMERSVRKVKERRDFLNSNGPHAIKEILDKLS